MEVINQEIILGDPWHGKTGTLSVVILALLTMFLTFAVYDGATFYTRFQQMCLQNPGRIECAHFNKPVPTKPKLDLVLDYGSGKYAIQVGAFKNENNAKDIAAQLQADGIQTRLIKVKDSKRTLWHQVQLGRFANQKIASQTAQQLKSKGIIQDFTVVSYKP